MVTRRVEHAKTENIRTFKSEFKCEDYVRMNLSKHERSLLCQFRSGILPLRIETGRYAGEPFDNRTCRFCDLTSVENEKHFLLIICYLYNNIKTDMLGDIFLYLLSVSTGTSTDDVINPCNYSFTQLMGQSTKDIVNCIHMNHSLPIV